jgi:hypothetical protein
MSNKIAPIPTNISNPADTLMEYMRMHVDSKLCYHSDPMKTAKFITKHNRFAYQIDLWTLMDRRKLKKCEKPYDGEPTPNTKFIDVFDYKYELPDTVLKKPKKVFSNLEKTQWKADCPDCSGNGMKTCKACKGNGYTRCRFCLGGGSCLHCDGSGRIGCSRCNRKGDVKCGRCKTVGSLLFWWKLHIKWYTIHSVSYQTNTPMTPRKIRKAPTKGHYDDYDKKWSYIDTFREQFEQKFTSQKNSEYPVKLEELAQEFEKKHLKKTKKDRRIVKLAWNIQILNITEVVYQLQGYTNHRMKDLSKFCFSVLNLSSCSIFRS